MISTAPPTSRPILAHTLAFVLPLTLVAPGCSVLSKVLGSDEPDTSQAKTEPDPEDIAKLDAELDETIQWLAERPVDEHLKHDKVARGLFGTASEIDDVAREFVDESARDKFRQERLVELHTAYDALFVRALDYAMASDDPELAQAQTSTWMLLQEDGGWTVDRADFKALFASQAEAIATSRQQVFAKRGEYTKLNELACIASDAPLAAFGEAQPNARWHFAKDAEVHVRCIFPTTIESQVAGGVSFDISGRATAWGSRASAASSASGREGDAGLLDRKIQVPVEVQTYWDQRYFDFAFDLGELSKGMAFGYVKINGAVEWTTVGSSGSGLSETGVYAPLRLSF